MLYFCEACYSYNKIWGMFKDRNDPAAWDFIAAGPQKDNTWRDLDLSAIVPENAKAVLIRLRYRATAIGLESNLRAKGKANDYNHARFNSQVANITLEFNTVIQCDTNRFVQYKIPHVAVDRFNLVVMGWWF